MIGRRSCALVKNVISLISFSNKSVEPLVIGFGLRTYSKEKGTCCKDVVQTEGKKVESWPKPDPPSPALRFECPKEPQPVNYDPYRIKVPDVAVPPLPPSNAKPMLDCAKTKGPCSVQPAPDPPPCPPPPPKPFPWIYLIAIGSFFSLMGLMYKLYLWKEEYDKVSDSAPIWRPSRKVRRPLYIEELPACVQYLIVGTGAAGWAAYRAIMEHDKKAKVFFITQEDILPYRRPPMSKHMWWNPEPPDLNNLNYNEDGRRKTMYLSECKNFMDPVKFYRNKTGPAVSIASGWYVLRVDAENHAVYLKGQRGEQPIYYERCLLAPGSKAKQMSIFKSAPKPVRERVCTLRTIRDLEIAYREVKKAKHVVIIGGGCLGCELAWHLGRMNKVVERGEDEKPIQFVHIFKDKGVLSNVLPEYLGEWAAEKIKCEHVTQMSNTQVYDAFESPDGRLELTLSNGQSLVTDYVFVAIGAVPRVDLAEPSYLELDPINGGFLVNTELEARKHLYIVVGEVGACMPTVGIFKRCEEDERAAQEVSAASASGDRPCYKKSAEYQNRYKRGMLFYLRDETIAGMVFWNMPPIDDRKEVVTEMLRAKPTYKDINLLAEQLGFADTQCVYKSDEELKEPAPCITRRVTSTPLEM